MNEPEIINPVAIEPLSTVAEYFIGLYRLSPDYWCVYSMSRERLRTESDLMSVMGATSKKIVRVILPIGTTPTTTQPSAVSERKGEG